MQAPLERSALRRGMVLSYYNAGLWAVGNGLTSTTLVVYLALELGAPGTAVGLILAAPKLLGVLRMASPVLMHRIGDRRRFCLGCYVVSDLLLLALPLMAAPGFFARRWQSLVALVLLWSLYHLFEYCGTVALFSWLGDLCPRRLRGRFFGHRERWLTIGRILGMTAAGLFAVGWQYIYGDEDRWIAYAFTAAAGAVLMLMSLLPLSRMPTVARKVYESAISCSDLLRPFTERRFARLMIYGVIFSLVNGLTQAAQNIFPYRILKEPLPVMLGLGGMMRLGQGWLGPHVGRVSDRMGNRSVMVISQTIVAIGPLFYLLASRERPWWLIGAWVAWIAYVGINVPLPALILKLSPEKDTSPAISAWFAAAGVVYGLSTIAGGLLFDFMGTSNVRETLASTAGVDHFGLLFLAGTAGRLLAAAWLLTLSEPGAWTLRQWVWHSRPADHAR